ncbi:helix-turn-helix domain-containing protein [Isoptericola variabilis]|uniref:helix-turn-helix domain-containing protein n=1 Tax=Isoptericola variabilis TaxID=139208 RepID=UPI003D224E77
MTEASILSQALGRSIAGERVAAGYSQRELAQATGISPEAIHRYEAGKRDIPIRALDRVAEVLELAPSDLLLAAEKRAGRAGHRRSTASRR